MGANHHGPYPFVTRLPERARNRNGAHPNMHPNDRPFATGVYFWPQATVGLPPLQAAAIEYANWQGVALQNCLNPCVINVTGHFVPPLPPSVHWDFDDCDPDFVSYDYADDAENFARDELAMAAAMADYESDSSSDEEQQMAAAMDAVCLDPRINKIFRPTNAN